MKLIHGSTVKDIKSLVPQYFSGNNGSQDGIGVNLTDNVPLALNYATKDGSIYIVDLNTENYLTISDNETLNLEQINIIENIFNELDNTLKYRLASDISGKNKESYIDDKDAEIAYKEEMKRFKSLALGLDRLKPKIDYDDNDNMMIISASDKLNLANVSTKHLHYCLNLYDNLFATKIFKKISSGLILERDNGTKNYLSFRFEEHVTKEITGDLLKKDNIESLINKICKKESVVPDLTSFDI
jgi:hypothetical protein